MYLHWLIDIFWEMASSVCWKIHFGVYSAYLLCNGNNNCCLCLVFTLIFIYKHLPAGSLIYSGKWHLTTAKKHLLFVVIILQTLYEYTACLDILGNGIISHFGVYSAHLLYNGKNSCCLCLAFILRFIYKHQLPMVLEDPNAKKPSCLWQSYYRHSMSLSILHAWIFCTLLESSLWCIKCTFTMQ